MNEALSDASMVNSVIVFGTAEITSYRKRMISYLQKLIDEYRVPESFEAYMSKPGRNREKELEAVRTCIITPTKITSRKCIINDKKPLALHIC